MRNVTAADSGTYWFGAENSDKERSKVFIHMLVLKVATTPAQTFGDTKKYWIIGSVVLLLVIFLITINKRNSHLRNTDSRAAELHPREDIIYEEIQEYQEASETAIYANNPNNDSGSLVYSLITFHSPPTSQTDQPSRSTGESL
ncbi:uncharacterized protein V3H82_006721 [Fundulus diaphanus]